MSAITNNSSEMVLNGGCYCGAVRYTIRPSALPTAHNFCHCRTCQRISGSAFLPFIGFPASQVQVSSNPPDALKTFPTSNFADRQFCAVCGSTLNMRYHANKDRVSLAVASFDDESTSLLPKPTQHIYVSEKAEWFPLSGDNGIKQHGTMEKAAAYLGGRQRQSE
ncbi:unnamed protein product [Discula destructiva]